MENKDVVPKQLIIKLKLTEQPKTIAGVLTWPKTQFSPRLIFAKIPVTKSTVTIQQQFRVFGVYKGVICVDVLDF